MVRFEWRSEAVGVEQMKAYRSALLRIYVLFKYVNKVKKSMKARAILGNLENILDSSFRREMNRLRCRNLYSGLELFGERKCRQFF